MTKYVLLSVMAMFCIVAVTAFIIGVLSFSLAFILSVIILITGGAMIPTLPMENKEVHYRIEKCSDDLMLLIDTTNPAISINGCPCCFNHGDVINSKRVIIETRVIFVPLLNECLILRVAYDKYLDRHSSS